MEEGWTSGIRVEEWFRVWVLRFRAFGVWGRRGFGRLWVLLQGCKTRNMVPWKYGGAAGVRNARPLYLAVHRKASENVACKDYEAVY